MKWLENSKYLAGEAGPSVMLFCLSYSMTIIISCYKSLQQPN